jgi:hypothetical protein
VQQVTLQPCRRRLRSIVGTITVHWRRGLFCKIKFSMLHWIGRTAARPNSRVLPLHNLRALALGYLQ